MRGSYRRRSYHARGGHRPFWPAPTHALRVGAVGAARAVVVVEVPGENGSDALSWSPERGACASPSPARRGGAIFTVARGALPLPPPAAAQDVSSHVERPPPTRPTAVRPVLPSRTSGACLGRADAVPCRPAPRPFGPFLPDSPCHVVIRFRSSWLATTSMAPLTEQPSHPASVVSAIRSAHPGRRQHARQAQQ